MRDDDGRLYTLVGDLKGAKPGDREAALTPRRVVRPSISLWLLSSDASYTTGAFIDVPGGR